MSVVIPLQQIKEKDREQVGGKAFSLATLSQAGMKISAGLCVKAKAYDRFSASAGLKERILLELNRKSFQKMRWEETWDTSLRIRNMFLNTPIPPELIAELRPVIERMFKDNPVVVRSSAPGEDSARASFAGLHESYVNVRGTEAILDHIQLVWASLWSDGALLYRQELGLDFEESSMAVVIQEIVAGEKSGVVFGKNPNDDSQAVIEAVHGLNAGLVDGTVEPDRWILDRKTRRTLLQTPVLRKKWVIPSIGGTRLETLPGILSKTPPLTEFEVGRVLDLAFQAEEHFHAAQDVEWTFKGETLYVLQSRPITTTLSRETPEDKRPWYLSLRRSFENLRVLHQKIEGELIPAMGKEADRFSLVDLIRLSDSELAAEIEQRKAAYERWVGVYWKDFIPFAHGMRLFGQVYNDKVRPQDPYEFMNLLGNTQLMSLERNRSMDEMASMIRDSPELAQRLRNSQEPADGEFTCRLNAFIEKFGDLSCQVEGEIRCSQGKEGIIKLLLEWALHRPPREGKKTRDTETLATHFLSCFEEKQRAFASELLDLGRASYRLRDDDNMYLGRIERQMLIAIEEGRRRVGKRAGIVPESVDPEELARALRDPGYSPAERKGAEKERELSGVRARQIVGQPAGPGIATGKARVILSSSDLFDFKSAEILVCDAIEPNMTFVVPLAAGIVERRGGMLIHGAIIAREYGLPCVTGVPNATSLIKTGDPLTVDGYLGIVVIG